jgi:hypothetical protein
MAKSVEDQWSRFTKAPSQPKYRIIGASSGEVGTGKTSFWLGAPGPIVVMSLDKGLEGVVEPFRESKDIYVAEYDWSPTEDLDQDQAIELRDKFCEDFEFAIQRARTVIWDKETNIWELFRYAEFGEPNDAPRNYPKLNQRYRKYLQMPKATEINFGCIQSMKDRWETRQKKDGSGSQGFNTGTRVRQGFSELDELVYFDLFHRRESGAFHIDIGKAHGPAALELQDQSFEGLSFVDFAQLAFPGTEETDWQ